ncbi:GNAT family N-acetyltransferase [Lactococcus cremoris]
MTTELIVREASGLDSPKVIDFLNKVGAESNFLTIDEVGILMSEAEMTEFLNQQAEKDNNAFLLLSLVRNAGFYIADYHYRIRHIAELFIAVAQDFQGYGIGSILLEDALDWIKEVGLIKRLELTVQARNHKARHLYEKFDFALEATKKWGARDENGQFIDICDYVLFFD